MCAPVYLDNHATTRVDPRVLEAMLPWFAEDYGNPASRAHLFGIKAEAAVENARAGVARLIGASPGEIVFTSGATESVNLAIRGIVQALRSRGDHVITTAVEHRAVLDVCRSLEREGIRVTVLPVDASGRVDPDAVSRAIGSGTLLVSVMTVNNEIGTIQPVGEIARLCAARGVAFHTDAAQAVGRIPVDVASAPVTALSFCAHKMYGPKGVGALYLRSSQPRVPVMPQMHGGGQERGYRPGTLNVPSIVGFGAAAGYATAELPAEMPRIRVLRDRLVEGVTAALPGITVNGTGSDRVPHNASMTVEGVRADRLMRAMTDVAVSSGSACASSEPGPSHVLRAIGLSAEAASSTIRFGLGRFSTEEEIGYAVQRMTETVAQLRTRVAGLQHA